METKIKMLGALLGAQLAVALGLGLADGGLSAKAEPGPMLTADIGSVDRISLEGPEGEQLLLARTESGWELPDQGSFPADAHRVNRLLERIEGLQAGLAVATSEEAQERFKVGDESFERKLVLTQGDEELATLYLGSSPRLRHIHARRGDDDAVYVVQLAAHDFPLDGEDWQDKAVLQFEREQIVSIELADLRIERRAADLEGGETKGEWQATLNKGESLNTEAAGKLAAELAGLRVGEVLGREARAEFGMEEPILSITVNRRDGKAVQYQLGKSPDTEEYTLKTSTRPEYFRLPSFRAQALVDAAKRETLVGATTAENEQREKAEDDKAAA